MTEDSAWQAIFDSIPSQERRVGEKSTRELADEQGIDVRKMLHILNRLKADGKVSSRYGVANGKTTNLWTINHEHQDTKAPKSAVKRKSHAV